MIAIETHCALYQIDRTQGLDQETLVVVCLA